MPGRIARDAGNAPRVAVSTNLRHSGCHLPLEN